MRSNDVLLTLLLLCSGSHVTRAADWSYWGDHDPKQWPGMCNKGKRQSPINIVTEDAIRTDLDALQFLRYDYAFMGYITNTGHTVEIELHGLPILLQGGGLPSTYVLEQMHFHWGAEHTIDGVRFPLELHFVHYDKQYGNVSMAAQHENGIAVVAALFQLSGKKNMDLEPIIRSTELISPWIEKNTADISTKVVPQLLLPKDRTTYYRYEGSLTTPMCQESVIWFVLTERLTISEDQLNVFKNVETRNGTLKYNYRPVQALNGRKVYHHLDGYSSATSILSSTFYTFLGLILINFLQSIHEV